MSSPTLAPEQAHALFDILTHHETHAEIEAFKYPDAVTGYGYPFSSSTVAPKSSNNAHPVIPNSANSGWRSWAGTPANSAPGTPRSRTPVAGLRALTMDKEVEETDQSSENDASSTSPVLQALLSTLVLPLPGVRELPRDFWAVRVQGLLARLGEAELSDTYDKGALGTRKVLATGASGLVEMVGRGAFGGVKRRDGSQDKMKKKEYDLSKADDLVRAWDDVVEGLVYDDLVDQSFDHFSKTADLESLSPTVEAAAQYAIIHLATLLHHIFVLSAEGQYLLKLLENVHNLIPYKMVKQTLRYGNTSVMMSAMMRLLLAKLSVTSITNWVGLTANADDGMNLLQRIISLVLSWDAGEFRKSADKIEKAKDRPSDEMLQTIREHIAADRDEHETVRNASTEHSQSIITAIFNSSNPALTNSLTEQNHTQCLEYYSALLSVRDRENITSALCRQPPDLFTAAIKDVFAAYEPIIRTVHSQVDLREHVEAGQAFIDDFIKTSKPKKAEAGTSTPLRSMIGSDSKPCRMATVDDYVDLLKRNRGLMYKWVHSLANSCPEVWEELRKWAKEVAVKFRQDESTKTKGGDTTTSTGDKTTQEEDPNTQSKSLSHMDKCLNELLQSRSQISQQSILKALDSHAAYLAHLQAVSLCRLQRIIDSDTTPGSMSGPGIYLARWHNLLDRTPITPAKPKGSVREGKDVKQTLTMGKIGVAGVDKAREAAIQAALKEAEEGIEPPDASFVIKEMSDGFRKLLQEVGAQHVPLT